MKETMQPRDDMEFAIGIARGEEQEPYDVMGGLSPGAFFRAYAGPPLPQQYGESPAASALKDLKKLEDQCPQE